MGHAPSRLRSVLTYILLTSSFYAKAEGYSPVNKYVTTAKKST